jgi:hypothetical protein
MRGLALLLWLFSSSVALATGGPYIPKAILDGVAASSNQTSVGEDMGDDTKSASFQVNWASLTGTVIVHAKRG